MTIEVPQNKEIPQKERMKGEKQSVLPSVGEERIGGAHIKQRERGVVKRNVDPYIIRVGIKRKREEVESSEKDRPCLTKMTTPR